MFAGFYFLPESVKNCHCKNDGKGDGALDYAEKLYYDLQIQRYDNYHPVKRGYKYGGTNWFYFTDYDLICPFIVWGNEYRSF